MKVFASLMIALLVLSGCATTPSVPVDLQPVDSSAVKAIGYDAATQTLFVQMLATMEVYAYEDVPAKVYKSFLSSKSKGRFYTDKVKGKYTSDKKN
ncbi:MAG: KTSC domain-containing protein [Lentisphaerae bacterium]|nr:KTSC domain-containing protein [Lentisphaerota bacterium]